MSYLKKTLAYSAGRRLGSLQTRQIPTGAPAPLSQMIYSFDHDFVPVTNLFMAASETGQLVVAYTSDDQAVFLKLSNSGKSWTNTVFKGEWAASYGIDDSANVYAAQKINDEAGCFSIFKFSPNSNIVWKKSLFSGTSCRTPSSSRVGTYQLHDGNGIASLSLLGIDGLRYLVRFNQSTGDPIWITRAESYVNGYLVLGETNSGKIVEFNFPSDYWYLRGTHANGTQSFMKVFNDPSLSQDISSYASMKGAEKIVVGFSGHFYSNYSATASVYVFSELGHFERGFRLKTQPYQFCDYHGALIAGFTSKADPIISFPSGDNRNASQCFGTRWGWRTVKDVVVAGISKENGTFLWSYGIKDVPRYDQFKAVELANGQISLSSIGYNQNRAFRDRFSIIQFAPHGEVPCNMYPISTHRMNSLIELSSATCSTFDSPTSSILLPASHVDSIYINRYSTPPLQNTSSRLEELSCFTSTSPTSAPTVRASWAPTYFDDDDVAGGQVNIPFWFFVVGTVGILAVCIGCCNMDKITNLIKRCRTSNRRKDPPQWQSPKIELPSGHPTSRTTTYRAVPTEGKHQAVKKDDIQLKLPSDHSTPTQKYYEPALQNEDPGTNVVFEPTTHPYIEEKLRNIRYASRGEHRDETFFATVESMPELAINIYTVTDDEENAIREYIDAKRFCDLYPD